MFATTLSTTAIHASSVRGAPTERDGERQPRRHVQRRERRSLVVVPQADLLGMSTLLQDQPALGVLSAQGLGPGLARELARCLPLPPSVRRPLHPLLTRGVAVHTLEVDSYAGKTAAVSAVGLLAAAHGLRRRLCADVEQALDEMLLNALYDAPVDEAGRPRYLHTPPAERVALRLSPRERAVVRCAGDERRFVVVVRDRFGSLRRETVLSYLTRCARAQAERRSPVEPKPGGAGVGLYLIATCATELIFRLRRGQLTEVVYAIDMAAPPLRALVIDDDAG